jgi:hypothetical protein
MPCSIFEDNQCFEGTSCLHLQGQRISQARNQNKAGIEQCLIHAGFLLGLLLDPKDGRDVSLKCSSLSQLCELQILLKASCKSVDGKH